MCLIAILNDVPAEAKQMEHLLRELLVHLPDLRIEPWYVRDEDEFRRTRERIENRTDVDILIADLKLVDTVLHPMMRLARGLASELALEDRYENSEVLTGLSLAMLFGKHGRVARRGLVIASGSAGRGIDYFLKTLPIQTYRAATMGDRQICTEIAEWIGGLLSGRFLPVAHRRFHDLLSFLETQFQGANTTPFPHDVQDLPNARSDFRAWAEINFRGLSLDGDEAMRGAYEAAKGLGPTHEVRLGSLVLLTIYRLGRSITGESVIQARPPIAIRECYGRSRPLTPSCGRWTSSPEKRPLLEAWDRLFQYLLRKDSANLTLLNLDENGLRLEFVGAPDDWEGLLRRYREVTREVAAAQVEQSTLGRAGGIPRAHGLTRSLLAFQLLSGMRVVFTEAEPAPHALSFLPRDAGMTVVVNP